jgi:cell division protein DivIC
LQDNPIAVETLKNWYLKLKPYLNKYIIVTVFFVVVIGFVDENSVVRRIKLEREISRIRKEIKHYEQLRDQSAARLESLKAGKEELERVAREEYLMKKENEDIFLIEE